MTLNHSYLPHGLITCPDLLFVCVCASEFSFVQNCDISHEVRYHILWECHLMLLILILVSWTWETRYTHGSVPITSLIESQCGPVDVGRHQETYQRVYCIWIMNSVSHDLILVFGALVCSEPGNVNLIKICCQNICHIFIKDLSVKISPFFFQIVSLKSVSTLVSKNIDLIWVCITLSW